MTTSPLSSPSRAAFLRADGISLSFGDHRVLTDVSFTVHEGARAGLIGQNGSGKSTLLRVLAGLQEPDVGTVDVPGGARIGLLWQDSPLDASLTLLAAAEQAQEVPRRIRDRVEQAGAALADDPDDPARADALDTALSAAERADVWSLEAHRDETLAGLGLAAVDPGHPVRTLSGGQRARLMLALLLLQHPDVLLLDEPTNHLDDDAADFLRRTLVEWHGPVIAASHDRAFLDDIATEILDLDPVPTAMSGPDVPGGEGEGAVRGLTRTRGRYSDHVLARLDQREAWERQFATEQAELRRLRARTHSDQQVGHAGSAPRTEARASKKFYSDRNSRVVKRRVDDAQRRLETLDESQVRRPPRELVFRGLDVGGSPDAVRAGVHTRDLALAGRLAPVTMDVTPGEQVLVEGPNGSGKSTLLALLAGRLAATSGLVDVRGRLHLLAQDPVTPDPTLTTEETYRLAVGSGRSEEVPLTGFGLLHPRDLAKPVGVLSTGQLRRLELAEVLADPPEVLALDEPTNHLSLDLVTALEALLPTYPGIVLVASHDRWLRRHWSGRTLHLEPTTPVPI
ncbi:MAG: ABC-F family ATP-binding cassette domain-containing protein [Pauljensenia sp.]